MARVHNHEKANATTYFSIIVFVVLALFPAVVQATAPKRVLIVYSFGRDFAPYHVLGQALRTELTQLLKEPVAFQEVSLDVERGGEPMDERLLVDYLVHRNRDAPPDLVISVANPAMLFCLHYRDQLSAGRPLLITGIDRRRLEPVQLGPNDQAITVTLDFPALAHTVLALQPDTKTLALVLGSTDLERFWAKEIMRELAPLGERGITILPPDGASLEQLKQRVASLPSKSAVLYYMFAVGADGVPHENVLALAAIREVSNAPVFGMFDDQLGHGIVGGPLVDARKMGSATAELAIHMLGNPDLPGKVMPMPLSKPAFDWRELQRWNIPESRLPAHAEVRFRPPGLWEEHRTLILVGSAVVLLQGVLITALILQRALRRRAEKTT
ncbi:MAG: ATPase, partial [Cellvibrio sp.]|nr:ATPase [Cellvibrio sp.]